MEEVKAIMDDVIQNLEKINHHGKRADGIVKGMLQHSRASGSQKEPTNINGLADEYLRLAYHGLRAKDKSFNATLVTDFDDTIGNINIIPRNMKGIFPISIVQETSVAQFAQGMDKSSDVPFSLKVNVLLLGSENPSNKSSE